MSNEQETDQSEDVEQDVDLNQIEKDFRKACDKAYPKIQKQLEIADKAIAKAVKLAEKYGVPFESAITPLAMTYTPESLDENVRLLDGDTIFDLTGTFLQEYEGWEHSAVC
jgi:hypothetical protein